MKISTRLTAATLAALAVTLGTPTTATAAVVPDELERGENPRVAWYDHERHFLHAGGRTRTFDVPGRVQQVRAAATGHLLQVTRGGDDTLHHLVGDGVSRRLARTVMDWQVRTGPDAGEAVAVRVHRDGRLRIDVKRVSDGRVLATRPARGALFDFHGDTVWFGLRDGALGTWNVRTGAVRRVGPAGTIAVEARFGTVVRRQGGCGRFVPIRKDATWSPWCAEQGVFGWSPDGRRVLTHTVPSDDDTSVTRKILVRDARTGALRQTFTGYFDDQDARWESDTAFLVRAADPEHQGQAALVRLRVDGFAVRASRLGGSFPWEAPVLAASAR